MLDKPIFTKKNKILKEGINLIKNLTANDLYSDFDKVILFKKDLRKKDLTKKNLKEFTSKFNEKKIEIAKDTAEGIINHYKHPLPYGIKSSVMLNLPEKEALIFEKKLNNVIGNHIKKNIISILTTQHLMSISTYPKEMHHDNDTTEYHLIKMNNSKDEEFKKVFLNQAIKLTKEAIPKYFENIENNNSVDFSKFTSLFKNYLSKDECDAIHKRVTERSIKEAGEQSKWL